MDSIKHISTYTLLFFSIYLFGQSPVIDIWYGDTQNFGNNGVPQVWCNIQGNVSDVGGITGLSLDYTLNGGSPISLNVGTDGRRLANTGDFTVDLTVANLVPGNNTVVITAEDVSSNSTSKTVTVNYSNGNVWPIPYSLNWSSLGNDITNINDFAHVVDGDFGLTADGIRTLDPDYDRLISIGDQTWTNYEVLVPVTIHSMPSGAGVGVLLRWKGHTDNPVTCTQPKCGWLPLGDIAWYRPSKLEFYEGGTNVSRTLSLNTTYLFRTSVETDGNSGQTTYRLKVWEENTSEPAVWDLEQTVSSADEQEGSMMLISHKADVTFGDVSVTPGSLTINNSNVQLANGNTEATITWNTNQAATSRVDYGLNASYGSHVEDANLVTNHSVTLTGLTPNTIYHYQISGENAAMEPIASGDRVFSTFVSGIVSDDFCSGALNPVWTFDDPLNDASYQFTGLGTTDAWLEISVPAGPEHQVYTSGINAPNMLQPVNNADFEVEVKFESPVTTPQYQEQGILVKESANKYLRFEFFSKAPNSTFLYAQGYDPAASAVFNNTSIGNANVAPLYMRVKREGNIWTQSYSFDGNNWTATTPFSYDLTPTAIGPYAGNATGNNSPAHIGKIDYFENLADPITNEDVCAPLEPPILSSLPNQNVMEGSNLSFNILATDPDGNDNNINFSASGLPSFAGLTNNNNGSATLQINPGPGDVGTYPVTITATDEDNLTDSENFDIFVSSSGPSNLISDDFCIGGPVAAPWTFVNPQGDGSAQITGAFTPDALMNITVPAGSSHELWEAGIQAPHIIQPANNTDFTVEVKMESAVNAQFQEQGILVKQDDDHFLRFEIYSNGSATKALTAFIQPDTDNPNNLEATITYNLNINPACLAPPVYMRIIRQGNQWTQIYSCDKVNWFNGGSFSYSMMVTGVGIYAGNASGGSAPAHTAQFDYFENIASPINIEDECGQLPVELTTFTVRTNGKSSFINWTTENETNNDFFEVQHSMDGINFSRIGSIRGFGNSTVTNTYQYVHEQPERGENYYRLRQVDYDGHFSFSPIRSVYIESENILSVHPNPTDNILNIKVPTNMIGKPFEIFNSQGRLIFSGEFTSTTTQLGVSSWPSGIYLIKARNQEQTNSIRFVKH